MSGRLRLAALLAIIAFVASGCASPGGESGSGGTGAPRPTHAPGLESSADGKATAYGWVRRQGLEGGFMSIVSVRPGEDATGKTVAVLLPGKITTSELSAYEGSYVRASGRTREGVGIRMVGPEMKVDGIEKVPAPK